MLPLLYPQGKNPWYPLDRRQVFENEVLSRMFEPKEKKNRKMEKMT
jgi:hypothetical protein